MKHEQGLSLIELMIALLISTILILGVVELFANTSASDRSSTAIARVQESGRVVLEMIGADARKAGYQGCVSSSNSTEVPASPTITFPGQAIDTSATGQTITFRYATDDEDKADKKTETDPDGAAIKTPIAFPSTNLTCSNDTLYLKSVLYANCTAGTSVCMDGQPIIDNAQITTITFGIKESSGNTRWITNNTITAAQLADARSVRIKLTINDPKQNISRDFSGTYEFRNRL